MMTQPLGLLSPVPAMDRRLNGEVNTTELGLSCILATYIGGLGTAPPRFTQFLVKSRRLDASVEWWDDGYARLARAGDDYYMHALQEMRCHMRGSCRPLSMWTCMSLLAVLWRSAS
jgi:hypothetical protein